MNEDKKVKQVLVWRKDLKVHKGKIAAQIAHASMACLLSFFKKEEIWRDDTFPSVGTRMSIEFDHNSMLDIWLNGIFTKICLCVEDEKELLKLYNKVKKERPDIPCELITDCGLTEFNGVPTNTCIGIGPFWSEDIDVFTKDLKLF